MNQEAAKVHFSHRGSRYPAHRNRFSLLLFHPALFKNRFEQERVLEACETIYNTLHTVCRAIHTGHGTTAFQPGRAHLQDSHTCTRFLLLFVILAHKCAPNRIFSYNKCTHTPCNIS